MQPFEVKFKDFKKLKPNLKILIKKGSMKNKKFEVNPIYRT